MSGSQHGKTKAKGTHLRGSELEIGVAFTNPATLPLLAGEQDNKS